tara:strand:- start:286 stop:618 length:333 start_codon:yes stop_codon:yes gene_type:complete
MNRLYINRMFQNIYKNESKYDALNEKFDCLDICMNLKMKNFKKEVRNNIQIDKEYLEYNTYQREMFDIRDRIHILEDQVNKLCSEMVKIENIIINDNNIDNPLDDINYCS